VHPLDFVRLKVHGHSESNGWKKLKHVAGRKAPEVFGIFCKFLEIAGDSHRESRGVLLDEKDGKPATIEDLSFTLGITVKQIHNALDILTKPPLRWIIDDSGSLPETYGDLRKTTDPLYNITEHNRTKHNRTEQNYFDQFWEIYPKKIGKGAAKKAWGKLRMTEEFFGKIIAAVKKHKTCRQWRDNKGQFIPNPATWLNQERWEDVPDDVRDEEKIKARQEAERQCAVRKIRNDNLPFLEELYQKEGAEGLRRFAKEHPNLGWLCSDIVRKQ